MQHNVYKIIYPTLVLLSLALANSVTANSGGAADVLDQRYGISALSMQPTRGSVWSSWDSLAAPLVELPDTGPTAWRWQGDLLDGSWQPVDSFSSPGLASRTELGWAVSARLGGDRHGVDIDLGFSRKQYLNPLLDGVQTSGQEYSVGMTYQKLDGRVWYSPDMLGVQGGGSYLEAGWTEPLGAGLSLSLRYGRGSFDPATSLVDFSDVSIGAYQELGDYALGLRVIERSQDGLTGEDRYRFMGSLSRQFP